MYVYKIMFTSYSISEFLSHSHLIKHKETINDIIDRYSNKEKTRLIEVLFYQDNHLSMSGTSNEFKVYATVVNAIIDYVKKHPDSEGVVFTAREDSRRKLYKRIAKYLAQHLNGQYFIEQMRYEEYYFINL